MRRSTALGGLFELEGQGVEGIQAAETENHIGHTYLVRSTMVGDYSVRSAVVDDHSAR